MNLKQVKIEDISFYDNNPRKNDKAVDAVATSIKMFGFKVPVVLDKQNVVVCGHTRIKAAISLGMEHVPCVIADDLTDEQIKAFRVADNRTHEFAEWDIDKLQLELSELEALDVDMSAFDFSFAKGKVEEDDFDVDAALEEIKEPITKPGDVWLLGRHRLVCGDSTVITDVERLMGGNQADMVFTDPPYNVNYGDKAAMLDGYQKGHRTTNKILNDNLDDEKFRAFLFAAYKSMYHVMREGAPIYVCHAETEGINFRTAFSEAGFKLAQCIIWVKNSLVLGRQDYHWQHEPILYGWKPGGKHNWLGGRKQSTVIKAEDGVFVDKTEHGYQVTFNNGVRKTVINVPEYEVVAVLDDEATTIWHVDKPVRNGDHPTMKPVALCARAINNSSRPGGTVLDVFGGSGSTLVACEQTDRACYTMELDPKYCDVIIKRWESLTGQRAELVKAMTGAL